jgi:hypothetical protein
MKPVKDTKLMKKSPAFLGTPRGQKSSSPKERVSLRALRVLRWLRVVGHVYLAWIGVVVAPYPICRSFAEVKRRGGGG